MFAQALGAARRVFARTAGTDQVSAVLPVGAGSGLRDPIRDSLGLALAYIDGNYQRLVDLIEPYGLDADGRHLLLALLSLVDQPRESLEGLALAGAGRSR